MIIITNATGEKIYIEPAELTHFPPPPCLQPENILCVRKNSNKIKIIDFGLAQVMKKGLKVSCGTPEFLAPEVVSYDEVSYTTDMWAVGVICYVL